MRADYDSPWKTMLTDYFEACLAFYFPEAHQQIDWRVQPTFLDKELTKLLPKDHSRPLRVDKLAKIKLHTGEEGRVVVHTAIPVANEFSA